ncbi:MAG: IS200/IS605 family transposase [Bacteroidota bacterium]|nr:IS200/IS605 family transposase [Bacteroidota bacterium]
MKPDIYSQVYIHLVFSPKGHQSAIPETIEAQLYPYMSQIIANKNHKPYIINGMPDHIHILLGINPNSSISDLVRDVKRSSSVFINSTSLLPKKFSWQEGYGVFSYGKSQLDKIYQYILLQKEHHRKKKFRDEYISFLQHYGVQYDEKYLFRFYD